MDLPEACIAHVLSFTSKRDACRLSLVSPSFCSAAYSDAIWDSFHPPDCLCILSRSSHPPTFPSKKHLYLSHRPPTPPHRRRSQVFWAKCFILSARSVSIVWGDSLEYWTWTWVPESRFEEVAELLEVCWLEIRGRINTGMLTRSTLYAAYLVFNFTDGADGFEDRPVEVSVGITGNDSDDTHERTVCSDPIAPENLDLQHPNTRTDGWLEIELGEFFNQGGDDKELEMAARQVNDGNWKSGLVIEGLEIRPKHNY